MAFQEFDVSQPITNRLSHLNPFLDYSSLFQPSNWTNALRWCHHPNTWIECDSNIKPITQLSVGDKVLADNGKYLEVTNIISREYSGDMVRIYPHGGFHLDVTADHKVYVIFDNFSDVQLIPAVDVTPDHYILVPSRKSNSAEVNASEGMSFIKLSKESITLHNELLRINNTDLIHNYLRFLVDNYKTREDSNWYYLKLDGIPVSDAFPVVYSLNRFLDSIGMVSYVDELFEIKIKRDLLFPILNDPFVPKPRTTFSKDVVYKDGYIFRRVKQVLHYHYTGPVYSLTIADLHKYVANGVLVANCEYIVIKSGILRSAIDRIISFFITDIEVENADNSLRKKYYDYLVNDLRIKEFLRYCAFDYITYGNFFVSVLPSINRIARCPECSFTKSISKFNNRIKYSNGKFQGICDSCEKHVEFKTKEYKDKNSKLILKRWKIYDIRLFEFDDFTGNYDILWVIPQEYKEFIRNKATNRTIGSVPREVLDAVDTNSDLKFNRDTIYHGKEESLSGVRLKGWGLSRIFSCIQQAWYVQVLHRMNEAIALDYVLPLRIITPMPRSSMEGGDPIRDINFGGFSARLASILDMRRRDPTLWHISPYPLDYKSIGGDGRNLAPREMFEFAVDQLLNSLSIPIEFYKGSIQVSSAPFAMRVLNSNWNHLVGALNGFLSWLSNRISSELDWEPVRVRLASPTHVDDINTQMLKSRLAMSGQLSKDEMFSSMGMNYEEDLRRQLEEQILSAQETNKAQERIEKLNLGKDMASGAYMQQMQQQAPPGGVGGAPGGGGGAPPQQGASMAYDPVSQILASLPQGPMQNVNPMELDNLATQVALSIRGRPEPEKDSLLRQLKVKNEMLWMVVKEKLNDMRAADSRQGVIMGQQQAAQAAAGSVQPPM
jgi:hypothetical protein